MNSYLKFFPILIFLSLAVGCVAPKSMYYYEGYSHSLYDFKKEPSAETKSQHMATIEEIFKKSKEHDTRVPPGIYAEYGSLLMSEGKVEDSIKYFQLEESTYPESKVLMERLISEANNRLTAEVR